MKEKKVLFIATVGGFVTQFEMNNVFLLQQLGYEVHSAANFHDPVYCVREQELNKRGVILHQVDIAKSPFLWRENLRAFKQLCAIVREEGISLIHCHTPVGGLLGRLVGILYAGKGLKVIYTAHGFHFYHGAPWINWLFYYHVEKFLAHYTDILITINQEDYTRAQQFKLRKGGKVYRIPGEGLHMERDRFIGWLSSMEEEPLEKERYVTRKEPDSKELQKKELRRRLGIPENAFFLLSVGELSGNKNHREMIQLMPELRTRLTGAQIFYGICGEGFCRRELEELIEGLGLEKEVKLFGYRMDIPDFLACADCLVFPSIREGLGMAALEALSMGVPVVASDNRGTREYMKDGCNGFVCDVKKPESFLLALEKIFYMRPDELENMCAEGRKTARKFELRNTDTIMAEIYAEADAEKQKSSVENRTSREICCIPAQKRRMRKAQ